MVDLQLADPSSTELTLEEIAAPIAGDADFQARAEASVEPMLTLPIATGDRLECFYPFYKRAEVAQVQGRSCILKCSVDRNMPYRSKEGYFINRWGEFTWLEVWAVRKYDFVNEDDPRNTWSEFHCTATQENRSETARETSGVIGKYIRAIKIGPGGFRSDYLKTDKGENEPDDGIMSVSRDGARDPLVSQPETKPQGIPSTGYRQAVALAKEAGIDVSDISGVGAVERIVERLKNAENTTREKVVA